MKIKVKNFNLKETVEGGQIFNYLVADGWHYIIHSKSVIKIRQIGKTIEFETHPKKNNAKLVGELLNFDANYLPTIGKYFKNRKILSSYEKYSGIKIARLAPWECLIGFICSQMNNMARIRKMVLCLSLKFGKEVKFDGKKFHLFPEPRALALATPNQLKACGLGYREYYIVSAARAVSAGFDFSKLEGMDYLHAKRALMMLPGIGEKVADCALLFSLGHTEAFPVDVWIKRVMENIYFDGKKIPEARIGEFARRKFGKDAAIVHEFLFANRENLG
ncbi:hypothetical protein HY989_01165 [Candidatus Micrarchaeota archaeon]|nr:hypothetical protein [Candidatus Micrarchaeota archaeon]